MNNKKGHLIAAALVILLLISCNIVYARPVDLVGSKKPGPVASQWKGLIGQYYHDSTLILVREENGRLQICLANMAIYPLEKVKDDIYKITGRHLFGAHKVKFFRNAKGYGISCVAGDFKYKRRFYGTEGGKTFRIKPLRPVGELRKKAMKARPPAHSRGQIRPDLVEITSLDPTIKLDIRYASKDNFMGAAFYNEPLAFLRRSAAKALVRVNKKLKKYGYGLIVFDAYRPWYVTKMFWDATPPKLRRFVANPQRGSMHNRGTAVDVSLYDLKTQKQIKMIGGFDEFTDRSYLSFPGGTSLQRWHRRLLKKAMESEGFKVYKYEWWHYDYKDWIKYPILNKSFKELKRNYRNQG